MGFFGFLFWMAVLWIAFRCWRRWESRAMVGPRGYRAYSGWYDSSEFHASSARRVEGKRGNDADAQQAYIDALETRVSDLEERLDFTERLLAERREPVS